MSRKIYLCSSLISLVVAANSPCGVARAEPLSDFLKVPPLSETGPQFSRTEKDDINESLELSPRLRRQVVSYASIEAAGTIIIDTPHTLLYYVLGNGKAIRYGIGVGRQGFTWWGVQKIVRKAEWPDWSPPQEMIERQPYLPRFMAGGPGNPLGARALYLGNTVYRIHGTNEPNTIGTQVSSGCIRLTNEDVTDLYKRTKIGTKVIVLPEAVPGEIAQSPAPSRQAPLPAATDG